MNPTFVRTLALLLAAATFEFFVPVFNTAAELACCDSEEMQCCQAEFPARMVCCIGDSERGLDDSVPTQVAQGTPQKVWLSLAPGPADITPLLDSSIRQRFHPLPPIHLPVSSRLYQELCTFLI